MSAKSELQAFHLWHCWKPFLAPWAEGSACGIIAEISTKGQPDRELDPGKIVLPAQMAFMYS